MYEAIRIIFPVLLCLLQGYCLQYFYGSFLEGRRLPGKWAAVLFPRGALESGRWNGPAAGLLYAAAGVALSFLEYPGGWDYRAAVGKLALSLLILGSLAVSLYRGFHLLTVFLVVTFQAVADISRYTAVLLVGELGDRFLELWAWCVDRGVFSSKKALGTAIYTGLIAEWILEYLAIGLLLYLPLRKIAGDFREKAYDMNRTELFFLLTPAAAGLMLCTLMRIIIITVEDGVPKMLNARYPILTILLPAILLLSLLSVVQSVKLFQDMIYRNRERSSRIVLENQVEGLKEHMEELERVYSGIRSMKHDMKNTFFVIRRLLEGKEAEENEELKEYLEELDQAFEKLELRFQTGNPVVDALLNMKYHEALRQVPEINMDADRFCLPRALAIRSYDIGVILGNALDNAIEACQKLKMQEPEAEAFIRLGSLMKGKLLILKVENSFDGKAFTGGADVLPATGKADKDSHGIGLANIRKTAEKYGGAMDFKTEGRVFILSVMMKNERGNEDGTWSSRQIRRT